MVPLTTDFENNMALDFVANYFIDSKMVMII